MSDTKVHQCLQINAPWGVIGNSQLKVQLHGTYQTTANKILTCAATYLGKCKEC